MKGSFDNIGINKDELKAPSCANVPVMDDIDALNLKEQKRERYSQDTRYRKNLAIWVMWVVSLWLLFVLAIIASVPIFGLKMEKEVQITLLATTTVNVLGLAYIVLKGIFNNNVCFPTKFAYLHRF